MYSSKTVWTDWMPSWVAMLMNGGWSLKVFFDHIPKCPARFCNIFLRTVYMWIFQLIDNPTFLQFAVFIFGCHEEFCYCVCALEMQLYSFVVTCLFELLPFPCMYGTTIEMFPLLFSLFGGLSMGLGSWLLLFLHSNLCSSWLSAQWGKWHSWRAFLMWFSSLFIDSWLEGTILVLCANVL